MNTQTSTSLFNKFFDCSGNLLCVINSSGLLIKINPEWEKTLGYNLIELEGKTFVEFVHPENQEYTTQILQKALKTQEATNFTIRQRKKGGGYLEVQWSTFSESGMIMAFSSKEAKNKQKEDQLSAITYNIPGTVYQFTVNKQGGYYFNYASDNSANYLKVDNKDLDTYFERIFNRVANYEKPRLLESIQKAIETQSDWHWEGDFLFPDGRKRVLRGDSKPRMLNGNIVYDGILMDITELKKTEQELKQNEAILRSTLESISDTILIINEDGQVTHYNNNIKELLAIPENVLNSKSKEHLLTYAQSKFKEPEKFVRTLIKRHNRKSPSTDIFVLNDERIIEAQYSPLIEEGPVKGGVWVFRDITPKVTQEKKLQLSQKLLQDSQRIANIGAWEYQIKKQELKWDQQTYDIYGVKDLSLKPDSRLINKLMHPEDKERGKQQYFETLKTKVFKEFEFRILHPEKGIRNLKIVGEIEVDENKEPYRAYGIVQDITEVKETKDFLYILKNSVNYFQDGVYWVNESAHFIYVNEGACRMLGYTKEELLQMNLFELDPEFTKEKFEESWRKVREAKKQGRIFETVHKKKDGSIIPVEIVTNHSWLGEKELNIAFVRNISERKKHENELLKRQKILAETQRISNVGGWELNIAKNELIWSKQTYKILGINNYELKPSLQFFLNLVVPEDRGLVEDLIEESILKKSFQSFQCRIIRADKKMLTVMIESEVVLDEDGKPVYLMGAIQDVTKQVEDTEAIRIKEQKLQGVFKVAQIGIGVLHNNIITDVNPQICSLSGRTKSELIGNTPKVFYSTEDEFNKISPKLVAQIKNKKTFETETIWTKNNGEKIIVVLSVTAIDNNNPDKGAVFTALDVTKHKQNEEALEKQILALTQPLNDISDIKIEDLFNLGELQKIQDAFADATGVASVITTPEGYPITKPSNISEFCEYIRSTDLGEHNCRLSDSSLAEKSLSGYVIQPCLSAGIWDSSAKISVGGIHMANWLIGQVRNEKLDYNRIQNYADTLKLDKKKYLEKYDKLPYMSEEKLRKVGEVLFVLAKEISLKSYQNIQQARFISEQKKAKEQILQTKREAEENEFFLQESQRTGNIGSFKWKMEHGCWRSTETLDKIFGIDKKHEKKFDELLNLIYPEDKENFKTYLQKEVLGKKRPFNYEFRIRRFNDKEIRWVHGIGKLILDASGEIMEILGVIQDITERKHIEEEKGKLNTILETRVENRTKQLKQANEDLESFTYSVSHDLRAPLRHIDGFLKLMHSKSMKLGQSSEIDNYYDKIAASSKKMSLMIDELLQFSRLGRADVKLAEVNLEEVIHNIIEEYKIDCLNRDIKWEVEKLPIIRGDEKLLRTAFENLISNAIKYTSKRDKAIIKIGTSKTEDNSTCIYIKDNGAGFDMAFSNKLFGVFQRLHNLNDFAGIGIGLANVKQIIYKHNGTIRAEAKIDKGATFYITLPK